MVDVRRREDAAVTAEHGADVWDTLLERAGADGSYTSLGSYSDAELVRLVEAASALTGRSASEILRWFGTAAMPMLHGRYPEFFAAHTDCGSFLRSLNDVIHAEVRKLYPGAEMSVAMPALCLSPWLQKTTNSSGATQAAWLPSVE